MSHQSGNEKGRANETSEETHTNKYNKGKIESPYDEDLFGTNRENLKANEPWGNRITRKKENTTRVYYQNVNGITQGKDWTRWEAIVHELQRMEVDMFGLAETNVQWNPTTKHIATQKARHHYPQCKLGTSVCDELNTRTKQQGGTCLGITGNLLGSMHELSEDERGLGRWTYRQIVGRDGIRLMVITAYRVTQDSITTGQDTVYNQQYRELRRQNVEQPRPKKIFDEDLHTLLKQ